MPERSRASKSLASGVDDFVIDGVLAREVWPIFEWISLVRRWDHALMIDCTTCSVGEATMLGSDHDVARSGLQE